MKNLILALVCMIQPAFSAEWKIESIESEPYKHSQTKGAIKLTVSITNVSQNVQLVAESPYPDLKGHLRPNTFLFKENETLNELLLRKPMSHFKDLNSTVCHELKVIKVQPNATVKMVMYDNVSNAGKRLALYIGSHDHKSNGKFVGEMVVPRLPKG